MTAAEIRQSFLDFFKEKQHTIVPSASLMPQSPGLLFTNAGMNQFVPYFLGTEKAPYSPPRATDTQKCIRAGGKHNDLEDVGYDTYHHTMFEMLGNWSFGDYFKKQAIEWAWELVVERWGFPADRLYATVYMPGEGDPGSFDQEAYDFWAELYEKKGLDPKRQIVNGNVKDNFWMMGETGPCGPCSELHVDLTPEGDTDGKLVNMDSDLCIEIWNLVFIQFNAEADGSFRDLPAKHIDTGMGFERAVSIYQGTKGFTDFSKKPTNYATDAFQPIFRKLEELSGKKYEDIYPESVESDKSKLSEELKVAIAFRVIADHIRTLSFSLADGILLGNNGRNYVLRRILRRAVRYGRTLGFSGDKPFMADLVDTLVEQLSGVFPELGERADAIKENLQREETSFNETLDRGLAMFEDKIANSEGSLDGAFAFQLYDTFGFPIDLTQLLCEERGLKVDMEKFGQLMEEQREKGRAARTRELVRAADISTDQETEFTGFEADVTEAKVTEIHQQPDHLLVITDKTPFYVEMGGQMGDQGTLTHEGETYTVTSVQQLGNARAHAIDLSANIIVGDTVTLEIETTRRRPIEAHHTATHLLHWALHEEVSQDAAQQGSMVSRNRLRFDFNSGAVSQEKLDAIEDRVNACIKAEDSVSWIEVPHEDVKGNKDIQQFFGDKYGDLVRVVQIGGEEKALNGYSMELCGGTHVRNTKDLGIFKIKSEGAIASGIRRIEAVCGDAAWNWMREEIEKADAEGDDLRAKLEAANSQLTEMGEDKVEMKKFPHIMGALLMEGGDFEQINATFKHFKQHIELLREAGINAEKKLKKAQAGAAAKMADEALVSLLENGGNIAEVFEGPANLLQELLNGLKKKQFTGAAFLIVDDGQRLHLGAYCGEDARGNGLMAGKLIQELGPIAGGKGGGKPDQARGAAPERDKAEELKSAAAAKL
ncbi:alanine--tRNA ligase [Verrucomicrobiaceae bacterium 5K15]|uniref:Alanine--tRNA ligase n=1 Tax=Oceaniferula flava TaxID=2800421 RepID=A0AAE2SDP1_9BACT|nr:alanine--tRNA ligase [Oceaniferula flavus]MBK1856280.1 alanine--tRNA ligase [Oceaniferula flavus]MBM1137587.1 alanine--tRNA ligase [Oceaniferula flavus]